MTKKYTLGYCAKNATKVASAKLLEAIHACEDLEEHLEIEMEREGKDLALLAKVRDRISSLKETQQELWDLQDYNKDYHSEEEGYSVDIKINID